MAFDLALSYSQDWEFIDWIEDVTWEVPGNPEPTRVNGLKGRWGDFDTPEAASLAAGLSFSNEAAAIVVWQPESEEVEDEEELVPFAPREGHILRREALDDQGWVVLRTTKSRFGHWLVAAEREVTNAD